MNLYFLYRITFLSCFMSLLIQPKYSIRKTTMYICSFIFCIWAANAVILHFTNVDFFNSIYPFTVSIPAFIGFTVVSKSNFYKVAFSFLTVCNFGMLTSYMGLLGYYFTGSFPVRVLFECLAILVVFSLTFRYFRKPYFKIINALDKGWFLLSTFPLLLSATLYLLLYYPTELHIRPDNIPVISLVFLLMFFFYLIVYHNFENITQLYQFRQDRAFALMQLDMHRKEYEALLHQIESIRIYRHDMRHHLTAIYALLNENKIPDAMQYLSKLDNSLASTLVTPYCENYMINVILSSYIAKAKDNQIDIDCKVMVSENAKIDSLELGLIFSNAIENAIHACLKIENPGKRKITISCREYYDQVYIQISNPFAGEILFEGEFPVSAEKDHGIGVRSIAAIALKYDGIFSFKAENGFFKTTVILNNQH